MSCIFTLGHRFKTRNMPVTPHPCRPDPNRNNRPKSGEGPFYFPPPTLLQSPSVKLAVESFISSATFLLFSCMPLYLSSPDGPSQAAVRSALTASSLADARLAIH